MNTLADTQWHDVSEWGVEGKGWTDTLAFYDRLPARAEGVVRDVVWGLSRMPSGLSAQFETDAVSISARWRLTSPNLAFPHCPASACSGVDLYGRDDTGAWRWIAASQPTTFPTVEAQLTAGLDGNKRAYRLYLPVFNGVESLEIGVPADASFRGIEPRTDPAIVYYGTSIVHGASASRPGMTHASILGRRLDVPMVNLGFSGNARMEPEVARFLAELDPRLYIVDALPNMEADLVKERAEPFVRTLREAHPETPIVLVEDRTFANAYWHRERQAGHKARRAALREAYDRLTKGGVNNLVYVPGEGLLGRDGEDSVDGSHPTDLGFMRLADALEPVLRPLL